MPYLFTSESVSEGHPDKVADQISDALIDNFLAFDPQSKVADYMPLALDLAHKILIELAALRRENKQIKYLRPDAKSQVTLEYDDNNRPVRIDAIVVSTQHDDFDTEAKMLAKIKSDIINILIPRVKAKYEIPA